MISLFQSRGDILLGLGTKNALIGTQTFLNVLPWRHAHGPILISDKVTTQVEADGACTIKLELILILQKVSDGFWVLGSCSNVIHIDANVLIDVANTLHPNVKFSFAWLESYVLETVSISFMPMEAICPEAIECLEDDEDVSFQITKFRACNDIDLFLSFCLKICIANVCCPDIETIQHSKEDKKV